MAATTAELERHYRAILSERMQNMPFLNPALEVEAVGFVDYDGHELGVLITPWFMNLVLLPGNDRWSDCVQGETVSVDFPSGPIEFTATQDAALGTYLTAALFSSVADFPDQAMARDVAQRVMKELFVPAPAAGKLSRRHLLTGFGAT